MAHLFHNGSLSHSFLRLLFWFLLTAPPVLGQMGPVKDIFPVGAPPVTFNGKLYFAASSAATGQELYRSDPDGTNQALVRDLNPGAASGLDYPAPMLVIGNTLYFVATEGTSGFELWKTDGTAAGTVRVKDIIPGAPTSAPSWFTNVNGTLFFIAATTDGGRELWKSNGTAAGTVRLKEFPTGPDQTEPRYLASLNGALYFESGGDLWKSNGTTTGTVIVVNDLSPSYLTAFNGNLYFAAYDDEHGRELWKSNGTAAGTVLVKDILVNSQDGDPGSSGPDWFQVVENKLYFIAKQALHYTWGPPVTTIFRTDGTEGGTIEVGSAQPLSTNHSNAYLSGLTVAGSAIYYAAYTEDFMNGYVSTLNVIGNYSDGEVKDLSFGQTPITELTYVNGLLFFLADDGVDGMTLWRSDGTSWGTFRLPEFDPRAGDLEVYGLFGIGKWLYFTTTHGSGTPTLWRYDITQPSASARPIRINAGGGPHTVYVSKYRGEDGPPDYYPAYPYGEDTYFTGGTAARYPESSGGALDNAEAPLYLNARLGQFSYNVPVTNGPYQVVLHFAEMYWGNGRAGGAGSRRFHVDAEGVRRLNNYDIFDQAGGAGRAVREGITVQVTDGTLNLSFVKGAADNPLVSAIEIIPLASFLGVPMLTSIGDKTLETGKTLSFTASALYSGTRALTYSLVPGSIGSVFPTGATINPTTGAFTWTAARPGSYSVLVRVSDNGNPAFYDEEQVNICVTPRLDLTVLGSSQCNVPSTGTFTFPAVIIVKNSEPGVWYSAYRGQTEYGSPVQGNGGDVQIAFSFTTTAPAPVTYEFDVRNLNCKTVTLAQKARVAVAPALNAPSATGKTISSGQSATLTATAAQAGINGFRWYAAATGSTPLATTASYTTPALSSTTSYYVATTYGGCESARTKVTVTVTGGGAGTFRVNAGGNGFATLDARSFVADAYFSGGVVSGTTAKDIGGTGDDYLYQTGRHGSSFTYNFPTGNGSYDVVLHFAETYFGNTAPGGVGSRKFHVNAEGVRKLTDYDIFARAGGALRVAQETFRVTVSDGTLNVAFLKGTADNPAVKAIEVLPAGNALTINSGGGAFTAASGKRFSADVYYASGTVSSIASGEIANTADDALYRNARVGVFSYGLPSGNGTFDVTLHFAETYWGSRAAGGAGSRKFNVYVENVKRLSDYDVFAKAGGAMRAVKETIRVTVTDGILNLYFAKGAADNPLVSAVEVVPVAVAARMDLAGGDAGGGAVTLYPNPVQEKVFITLPFPADQVRGTAVTDASGAVRLRNAHALSGPQELRLETAQLRKGWYLLRLDTENGLRVVKFVKQ